MTPRLIIDHKRFAFGFPALRHSTFAFTLAELLIALAILGVIATFTIPKILQSQQDGRFKAIEKEAAATISQAYSAYQYKTGISSSTTPGDLTQFMNYTKVTTSGPIDSYQTDTNMTCSALNPCLFLHNGAEVFVEDNGFAGTLSTNAIQFYVDPDGSYGGTTNGTGKSVLFFLYYDGAIRTYGSLKANTSANGSVFASADPTKDPPWFSWN